MLAEEWSDQVKISQDGRYHTHEVRHSSIIDGHYVQVHFNTPYTSTKKPHSSHYDTSFTVDHLHSKVSVKRPETGRKILHHVVNVVRQFPKKYLKAKSLDFTGSDVDDELANRKSKLYSKIATHHAGAKASTDAKGNTKVELREWIRRLLAEEWSERRIKNNNWNVHLVKHSSEIDGHKVDVHFASDNASPDIPQSQHYGARFTVNDTHSRREEMSSKTGRKILHHVAKIARQFPEKYPEAESLRFKGDDVNHQLANRKSKLYTTIAKHYAGDKKIVTGSSGMTHVQLREWVRRLLAEEWRDKWYGGRHVVSHFSEIDGHEVDVHFKNQTLSNGSPFPHYTASFKVDGQGSRHNVPSKTGHKILHHVIKTVKQFPERYPHAESLSFEGGDENRHLGDRKSDLYNKLAKHYAGDKKIQRGFGKTHVQLREWVRQLLAEKWSEEVRRAGDGFDHRHIVHHHADIDGHKVHVEFTTDRTPVEEPHPPHYEADFSVDGQYSKKYTNVSSKTGRKILHHVADVVRRFPKKYPEAKSIEFSGGDADASLMKKKTRLYAKMAAHYAKDKKIIPGLHNTHPGLHSTHIELKEWVRRLLAEKWEDPRSTAKEIYHHIVNRLTPGKVGSMERPISHTNPIPRQVNFVPHLPVRGSQFVQDMTPGRPITHKINIGLHPDDKPDISDMLKPQRSLFPDFRPPRTMQTPLTHRDIEHLKTSPRLSDVFAHEFIHDTDTAKKLYKGGQTLRSIAPPMRKKERLRGWRTPIVGKKRSKLYYNDPSEVNAYTSDLFHMAKTSGLPASNIKTPEHFRMLANHIARQKSSDERLTRTRGTAVKHFIGKNRKKLMRRWQQENPDVKGITAFPKPKPPKAKGAEQLTLPGIPGPAPKPTKARKPQQLQLPLPIKKGRKMNKNKPLQEKAPPGAKYERMVKHIKAKYAKDGLTDKEKGIAFATAWKAKKRAQLQEINWRDMFDLTPPTKTGGRYVQSRPKGTAPEAKDKWNKIIKQIAKDRQNMTSKPPSKKPPPTVKSKSGRNELRVAESMSQAAKIVDQLLTTKDRRKKDKIIAKAQRAMNMHEGVIKDIVKRLTRGSPNARRKGMVKRAGERLDKRQVKTLGHKFSWQNSGDFDKLRKDDVYSSMNKKYTQMRPDLYGVKPKKYLSGKSK